MQDLYPAKSNVRVTRDARRVVGVPGSGAGGNGRPEVNGRLAFGERIAC
jgi:hypothetical protein